MKKILLLILISIAFISNSYSQILCNPNGSYILYTNYDGGTLNINIDVNIPNIKIGVVSYEAVSINLSGTYVNNVTAVTYAGYNSMNNNNCMPNIPTTVINGAPGAAVTTINFAPASPLNNPYGYPSIICGYSCDTNVTQGGCNTIDQIEAYFQGQFPGAIRRYHKIQYGCWSGTYNMSASGTCCITPIIAANLNVATTATQPTCNGMCNGIANATASGGTPPYTYQWTGGPANATYSNLCPGTYTVTVTDAGNTTGTNIVTITNPAPISTSISHTACFSYYFNGANRTTSGLYKDTLVSANNCDSIINLTLTINTINTNVTQAGNTLTATATGINYQWYNCSTSSLVVGAVAQSFTPTSNGSYAVILTSNGCTDTSACKTVVLTNTSTIDETSIIAVYPNPPTDLLTIDIDNMYVGKKYFVYDAVGKLIRTGVLLQHSNSIDVQNLSKGMYIIALENVHHKWKIQK